MKECIKPVPVKSPAQNRTLFALRCMIDLQLLTINRFLRKHLSAWRGQSLDVGAGESPWRFLMGAAVEYHGIDTITAQEFGMSRNQDITYYAGDIFPLRDSSFDNALCIEVLEHVPDPGKLISEISRVLKDGGTLIMTTPWSARLHHIPHDYARFSPFALRLLLDAHGFNIISIQPRGNDLASIANKLIIICLRLLKPSNKFHIALSIPAFVAACTVTVPFLLVAHATMLLNLGPSDDPPGYALIATKRCAIKTTSADTP